MNSYKILLGLVLTFFLTSCSSGKFYTNSNNKTLPSNINTFDVKEIKIPFQKNPQSVIIVNSMKEELVQEIKKQGFTYDNSNPDIIIEGSLIFIDEGNAALRYFIGYGAGKAEVKFDFKITSTESTNISVEGKGIGSLSAGAFGGNIKIMCDKIAKDLAKQLKTGKFQ
jgi:hypothetical protein